MDSIVDHEKVNVNGKTTVDFHYFIQSAVQKNISWNALAMFLTDLAPTLDQSREVIKMLVQELEKWVTKVENQAIEETIEPQILLKEEEFQVNQNTFAEMPDDIYEDSLDVKEKKFDSNNLELNEIIFTEEMLSCETDSNVTNNTDNQFHEFVEVKNDDEELNDPEKNKDVFEKDFLDQETLATDEIIHKEKPYKCYTCNKSFGYKGHLNSHARTHTGEKPFQCKHCEKSFTRSDALKRHERKHTGEKPYQCTICSKNFGTSTILKRHVIIHMDEKPFVCKNCEKCFSRLDKLKEHEAFHHKYGNKMISFLKNGNQNT